MSVVTATLSDNFNRANGPVGGIWERKFLFGAFSYLIDANQCAFFTNTPGFHEDLRVPQPPIPYNDVTVTIDVTDMTPTGTSNYLMGVGLQTRGRPTNGTSELQYDAYSYELYRTENHGLGNQWVLDLLRLHAYPGGSTVLLDVDSTALANVALPGVLTATASGPNLTATFTHSGIGPPLSCSATDTMFNSGWVTVGCAHDMGSGTGRHAFDNFSAVGTRMAATADLIQTKLDSEYSITNPTENNAGALLQRWRADNNLQSWEAYLAALFAVSTVDTAADAANQYWDAFVPTP